MIWGWLNVGRRTHKKEIPQDAFDYKGKPWTRLMIMAYCDITPHQYAQYVNDRHPTKLLEWGAQVIRKKRRAVKKDLSRIITLNGISLTVMQWFYFVVKQSIDNKITYRDFHNRIGYFKNRQNMTRGTTADQSALWETFRSMGIEGLPVQLKKNVSSNADYLNKHLQTYLDTLNEYHQQLKDGERDVLKEPEYANNRWFECLLADTRLHWLFIEEYDKEMEKRDEQIKHLQTLLDKANANLDKANVTIREQERQIADFRRGGTLRQRT